MDPVVCASVDNLYLCNLFVREINLLLGFRWNQTGRLDYDHVMVDYLRPHSSFAFEHGPENAGYCAIFEKVHRIGDGAVVGSL